MKHELTCTVIAAMYVAVGGLRDRAPPPPPIDVMSRREEEAEEEEEEEEEKAVKQTLSKCS